MRRVGSAMIIAFFLMAAVAGVAFGIARLLYLDTSASGIYESSTIAYYAAESGVEEGLLRYRFDRQIEVPVDTAKVNRSILSNQTVSTVAQNYPLSSITDSAIKYIYDLQMSYKTPFYGNDVVGNGDGLKSDDVKATNYDPNNVYTIQRDESVKIDITDTLNTGGDINLYVLFERDTAPGVNKGPKDSFIEAKITGTSGSILKEYKKVLLTSDSNYLSPFDSQSYITMTSDSGSPPVYSKSNLKNAITGSVSFSTGSNQRVFLYLKPIWSHIIIGIALDNSNNFIAAPYTTVKSTGYYGNVSRTLEAKIDRQSGTVYDLFDFVVYQHQ